MHKPWQLSSYGDITGPETATITKPPLTNVLKEYASERRIGVLGNNC